MALVFRSLTRNCIYSYNLVQPVKYIVTKGSPIRILASGSCYRDYTFRQWGDIKHLSTTAVGKQCSAQPPSPSKPPDAPQGKKGLMTRLKEMYRDYWYVVVPVHVVTSAVWFGCFYYAVKSGVDVIAILQTIGVSEKLIAPLQESKAGYYALAFALYKLASPLRYAVTIGGTTIAIKRLTAMGWIKPVPSKKRMKEMFQERKDNLQDRFQEGKDRFQESRHHYRCQMKEKRRSLMDEMRRYKTEIRNIKNRVKKM